MKPGNISLIEIAFSYLTEEIPDGCILPQSFFPNVRQMYIELLEGKPVKEKLANYLKKNINTDRPLLRILDIMTVEETSFPNNNKSLYNSTEKRKRPWSHVEDNRLIAAVNKLGMTDWEAIARFVGNGRSRPQCSQRWKRALDPRITKEPWTPAEEQKLIELVREHGAKGWGKISLMMGSRSDLQCRYRYEQIKRQRGDAFKYSSLPFFNSIYGFSRIYNNSGKLQFSDKEQNIIPQQYSIQELLSKPNNNEHKKLDSIACILSKAELESLQMNVQVKQCVQ